MQISTKKQIWKTQKNKNERISSKCPDAIFYHGNESNLFLPSKENKLTSQECYEMAGSINSISCINRLGDSDCLLSIFCLIAKTNQWEDAPTKPNDVRTKASGFIKKWLENENKKSKEKSNKKPNESLDEEAKEDPDASHFLEQIAFVQH